MEVEAIYQAPSSKTFNVVKESGSGLLLNRVLKRLIKSEEEAAHKQDENALTPANYNFSLAGTEVADGRPMYILRVEPKAIRQLLFQGRVWVDAQDFAVAKVEAQPAQNPSFWIKNTQIHHLYAKVGDLWLPLMTQSETKVRLGGVATLTILYANYQVESAAAMREDEIQGSSRTSAPLPLKAYTKPPRTLAECLFASFEDVAHRFAYVGVF